MYSDMDIPQVYNFQDIQMKFCRHVSIFKTKTRKKVVKLEKVITPKVTNPIFCGYSPQWWEDCYGTIFWTQ